MFTQLLGAAATVYRVLGALNKLLQARQMHARRTSREVSARFLASYAGGYAIWLAYGPACAPGPPPTRPAGQRREQKPGPTRPQRSRGNPATRAPVAPAAPHDYADPDA